MGQKVGLKMKTGKLAPLIKEYYPDYYLWCEYPCNQCVTIRKVDEEWGILGNFHPTSLNIDGLTFVNSEQLFQCFKFRDKETLLSIYNKRGLPIKWSAKSGETKGYRGDWDVYTQYNSMVTICNWWHHPDNSLVISELFSF
jgi:hypothetical protein